MGSLGKSGSGLRSGNKVSQNTFKNTPEDDEDTFWDIISHSTSKYRPDFLGLRKFLVRTLTNTNKNQRIVYLFKYAMTAKWPWSCFRSQNRFINSFIYKHLIANYVNFLQFFESNTFFIYLEYAWCETYMKFFFLFCEVPNYSFGLSVSLSVRLFFKRSRSISSTRSHKNKMKK